MSSILPSTFPTRLFQFGGSENLFQCSYWRLYPVGRGQRSPPLPSWKGSGSYFSHTVTVGALKPPTHSSTAAGPGGTKPAGTRALTCSTPTAPGTLPAYNGSAVTPAMVKVTGSSGRGYGAPAA